VEPDFIRKFFLKANPNPDRVGCPDRDTLKAIAENTVPPDHPNRLHLASCSPCFEEFRELKEAHRAKARRRTIIFAAAVAACFGIAVVGVRFLVWPRRAVPNVETASATVTKTVDLFKVGTFRGVQPNQLEDAVSLPAARVRINLILPRLSESGLYRVCVTRDKTGQDIVAEGTAPAAADGPREIVIVTLNLRSATPGFYFLSTTRDKEEASYYYPVKIGN